MAVSSDAILGALLGTAVGDALGMPIEGLSHQNVRTYYKGIKEYRDDDQRGDLDAGQWTDDTQMRFALVRVLADQLVDIPLDLRGTCGLASVAPIRPG